MSGVRSVLLLCWRDTGHPQGGGSETYLQRIGAQLAAAGVDVTLRTARYPGAARREVVDGVHIDRAGGRYSVYVWALLAMAAARLGIGPLRRVRPDVVVDTQNGLPFLARLIYGRRVAVLVHHCHREQWPVAGWFFSRLGWFVESWLSPKLHRRNQYVTVSLPSARDLVGLGVDNERIAVVRNGLDEAPASSLTGPRAVTPRVLVLSRLVPHKQIEDALTAVAQLRPSIPDLHLDIVGGGWWSQSADRSRDAAGHQRRGDISRTRRRHRQTPCHATGLGARAAVTQRRLGSGGHRGGPARGAHHRLPVVRRVGRLDHRRSDRRAGRRSRRTGRVGFSSCLPIRCCAISSAPRRKRVAPNSLGSKAQTRCASVLESVVAGNRVTGVV